MDYYKTLGIQRNASPKAVKDAYRQLARELHPDVNPSKAAAERFKKVNEAYGVLNDPKKRKKYDQFGENWKHADRFGAGAGGGFGGANMGGGFGGAGFNLGDILEGMFGFGGAASRQRAQQAQTLEAQVQITLEEAYFGTERKFTINAEHGSRTIEVKIPAGIADGGKIKVQPNGVVINVKVAIKPHAEFKRDGLSLHQRLKVPLRTLLAGGEVTVPTLSKAVVLKIPAGTQNGRVFRLRGKGMPKLNSKTSGDMLVEVAVELPVPLTDADQSLLAQMSFMRMEAGA